MLGANRLIPPVRADLSHLAERAKRLVLTMCGGLQRHDEAREGGWLSALPVASGCFLP